MNLSLQATAACHVFAVYAYINRFAAVLHVGDHLLDFVPEQSAPAAGLFRVYDQALATEPTYWNLWLYFPTFAACLTASFVQFKNLPTLARHILAGIAEEKEPEGAEDEGEEHDDANDNYYQNNHHRSTTRGVRMAQPRLVVLRCVRGGGRHILYHLWRILHGLHADADRPICHEQHDARAVLAHPSARVNIDHFR